MHNALSSLRQWLSAEKLDAFILPRADLFLGEYVAPHDEMLAWLTGFTGSAGFAVVTQNNGFLYTDGRYQIQAKQELNGSGFELHHSGQASWQEDISDALPNGGRLGFDPWLHSIAWRDQVFKKFSNTKIIPVAVDNNPANSLWEERPAISLAPAEIYPLPLAGKSSAEKCEAIAAQLKLDKMHAELINDPTLTAWLLNIRGRDVPFIPVAQARCILYATGQIELFIHLQKFNDRLRAAFDGHLSIRPPGDITRALELLRGKHVRMDGHNTPVALRTIAQNYGVLVDVSTSTIPLARAQKNETEMHGMVQAHRRDAAALSSIFSNIQTFVGQTEHALALAIAASRAKQADYVDESFPAIVGWNGNGAIVHYRPDKKQSAVIGNSGILLIDSGGQYRDGTTDITRTFAIGTPTPRQREVYTRVLKGHLAIARAKFPVGTTGHQLDALARQFLWEAGLDYDHGTGHGVGCFLSVHEGPQSISNRHKAAVLLPGMVLSNEPGCYIPGEFGVRIENLECVVPSADDGFLEFKTITLAYYDENLFEPSLLTAQEYEQINQYHRRVKEVIQ